MWRWLRSWRMRRERSAAAWRALLAAPDTDPGLRYPDGHARAGESRRTCWTRFPHPDRTKLEIKRRSLAPVVPGAFERRR